MHFVHERELADGEGVGEDDVGESDPGIGKSGALLGPGRPLCGHERLGFLVGPDSRANDGHADGNDDGGEVDVTEHRNLGERRWHSDDEENDGRDDTKDERADGVAAEVEEGDGSGETVRSDEESELEGKHGTDELVAKATHHELTGVGVVRNLRELDLDLADNVAGVDGDDAHTDAHDDAGDHSERSKCRGNGERTESNGLDDEADGELLPTETVELVVTLRPLLLLVHVVLFAAILLSLLAKHGLLHGTRLGHLGRIIVLLDRVRASRLLDVDGLGRRDRSTRSVGHRSLLSCGSHDGRIMRKASVEGG